MASERKTENIVRAHFGQYSDKITVEEQQSDDIGIKNLLGSASKSGSGHVGKPEFIIKFNDAPDLLCVIECKAETKQHCSKSKDQPADYAVDGALHYASYLSKKYDVLAIGVSGATEENHKVSHYLKLKGQDKEKKIFGDKLLSPDEYVKGYFNDSDKVSQDYNALRIFMQDLNKRLQKYKVSEKDRSILISEILIALDSKPFCEEYKIEKDPSELAKLVVRHAMAQLKGAGISEKYLETLQRQFSFLPDSKILLEKYENLRQIIADIDREFNSFVKNHEYRDVLGEIYIEFLRYANSDTGLGIVLTPPHITELCADIAEVNAKSVVYDNCAGTGGFLISAMKRMVDDANGSQELERNIKKHQIHGTECASSIYPLAVSNMYVHQDGKSNIIYGDCFDVEVMDAIKLKKPTVGFLNPPFKGDKTNDRDELEFVWNNLECLQQGGVCVAVLPMQAALASKGKTKEFRDKIIQHHTLEAVFSMPNELFFNSKVSTVTCIMVFTAHRPHPSNKDVFLGYFKDDGFKKRRIGGRCDADNQWKYIKKSWIDLYLNRRSKPGMSVCRNIEDSYEWSAEAYMQTDYSGISRNMFEKTLLDFSTYLFSSRIVNQVSDDSIHPNGNLAIGEQKLQPFALKDLFDITGTKTTPVLELEEYGMEGRTYPYVTTSSLNNGVAGHYAHKTEKGNVLTIDSAVVGYCSYQPWDFSASDHVEKLILRNTCLDPTLAMFLVSMINMERYRYNYGRKCSQTRLKKSFVSLPVHGSEPDFDFMRDYIQQLKFSSNLVFLTDEKRNEGLRL